MVTQENYDLILLDVMMPGVDGYEVCRRLKEKRETRDIPVLFLTAKSEQDDVVRGFREGAVDYLTKPFKTAELVARVRTHVALRNARRDILERNTELEEKNRQLQQLIEENQQAMSEIKILRGILPICSQCKKIRDDEGYWTQIEAYISEHSDVEFTHGMCAECAKELYPDFYPAKNKK